ncbi:unnamed protein product [Urochloa decumbens]|uniref:Uncharacterized protein n=1 Tax=Urochloa decumbens TaxID=240449 RepID=A0ABC9FHI6_9POAL
MGNCQAAEAAAVVIQHPGGKVERLYWATTAAEVMQNNPGHYVALVILRVAADKAAASGDAAAAATAAGAGGGGGGGGGAKITRVKLLKPKDTLMLGQVYRLITTQEVTKALRARKNEKMQRCEAIRQQHEQLRRGGDGGADHGSSDQVGQRFLRHDLFPCCERQLLNLLVPPLCDCRTGSRRRTGTGEEAGTGGRRCRASPRQRARAAAAAASLKPPPANATDRTVPCWPVFFFFLLVYDLLVSIKCLSLASSNKKKKCKSECQSRINRSLVSSLM